MSTASSPSSSSSNKSCDKFFTFFSWIIGCLLGFLDILVGFYGWFAPSNDYLFFADGLGNVNKINQVQDQFLSQLRTGTTPKSMIINDSDINWGKTSKHKSITITTGQFQSPMAHLLPKESKMCHFHHVQPIATVETAQFQKQTSPVTVILFPATGEVGNGKRLRTAQYLANTHGWSSIIITAPLYGTRKPKNQTRYIVRSVELLMAQYLAIMQEGAALAMYLFQNNKKDHKVCMSGFSWGAAMAFAASTITTLLSNEQNCYSERLACAPYAGSTSPSVFMKGCLKFNLCWEALKAQDNKNNNDVAKQAFDALDYLRMQALTDIVRERRDSNDSNCDNESLYIGSVYGIAMKNDFIIPPEDTSAFANEIKLMAKPTSTAQPTEHGDDDDDDDNNLVQWLPGGHGLASFIQPIYQKELIVKAIRGLDKAD